MDVLLPVYFGIAALKSLRRDLFPLPLNKTSRPPLIALYGSVTRQLWSSELN